MADDAWLPRTYIASERNISIDNIERLARALGLTLVSMTFGFVTAGLPRRTYPHQRLYGVCCPHNC
jgi:hypothetical protein